MKYAIIISLLLTVVGCKKEDKACYTCTQRRSVGNGGGSYTDTTRYCDKTPDEIEQIIDVAPFGTFAGAYYTRKQCKKN